MIFPLSLPKSAAGASAARREQLNQNALPYLCAAFFVLLAWVGYERIFPIPVFPVDDAYIVIHNAQVLLGGSDPNYPGSPPLSGATSAVHLAAEAPPAVGGSRRVRPIARPVAGRCAGLLGAELHDVQLHRV